MDISFETLPAEHIIRIAKEVSLRQTQEDFVPDGACNVFINTRDGKTLLDFFASAGATWAGYGNPHLKLVCIREVVSKLLNNTRANPDTLNCNSFSGLPDYPLARMFIAGLIEFIRETFVPDPDCYTVAGTALKYFLTKELYPWKRPMVAGLFSIGSEANEKALKTWFNQRPERTVCLTFSAGLEEGAFPGRTLGSLALNASKEVHRRHFPKWGHPANPIVLPYPRATGAIPDAEAYIKRIEEKVDAALNGVPRTIIQGAHLELVLGEGGFYAADRELLYAFERWRKENDVLLLIDEIQTGMCWTGTMLALEQYPELDPDAVTLGKAIACGIAPVSATIVRSDFNYEEFGRDSSTAGGYQFGAAIALETIKWMMQNRWWNRTRAMGTYIAEKVRETCGRYQRLLDPATPFSGLGMMQGVGFSAKEIRDFVKARVFEKGLFIEGTGYKRLRLRPPQIITESQFDQGMLIIDETLREADHKFS
ncbi:MAG: hypothetical protein A2939_04520 [Parcubacteria group bacterium RIFCSPLOWO2_01_FULL_48_18]|nr:MAG: hypothetical protein A2939_04520 [Parcubacteria group bacterium RIFCSPLOWO2_01_FULL_48_18]